MYVTHLSLSNFRNFVRLELDLPSRFVVLEGQNAQGKTNLLEAVFYLATTRSPRSSSDREMVNWLAQKESMPFAKVGGLVRKAKSTVEIDITLMAKPDEDGSGINGLPAMAKRIRVNGLPKRAVDLIGQIGVVMFSPQDIDLVGGSPQLRRRYLDIMNSQIDSQYLRALQQYGRVLVQRNHLLRLIRDRHAQRDQLAFWDEQMVEWGSYIIVRRRQAVEALNELAQTLHPQLTGRQEHLRVSYISTIEEGYSQGDRGLDLLARETLGGELRVIREASEPVRSLTEVPPDVSQAFRERLSGLQDKEIALGMSIVGPHRDDLQFRADGVDLTVYGSRGQQRTAALSLKLAEVKLIHSETGETPVLLLDDIMSELDGERRSYLLDAVGQAEQVLITTTDLDRFGSDFLSETEVFRVVRGQVERLSG